MNRFILAIGCVLALLPLHARATDVVQTCASSGPVERTRFSAEVSGAGRDVLLIPGLSTPGEVWDDTVAALASKYRIHRIELRGFGTRGAGPNGAGPVLEPFVEELASYIAECHIDKPALVGHSMGGLAALMVATRHPDLPGRVVVVDAAPFIGPLFNPPSKDVEGIRPMADQLKAGLAQMASMPRPAMPKGEVKDPGEKSQAGTLSNIPRGRTLIAGWMWHVDMRVVGQVMYDVMLTDLRPELARISVPVELIYAQDDRHKSAEETAADYLPQYATVKDFQATPVRGSFHFVMLDQPVTFLQALKAALERGLFGIVPANVRKCGYRSYPIMNPARRRSRQDNHAHSPPPNYVCNQCSACRDRRRSRGRHRLSR